MKGKVLWFNKDRGFGFIEKDNGEGDIFVHYSDIQTEGFKDLREGEMVEFDAVETDKGLKAVNVKKQK